MTEKAEQFFVAISKDAEWKEELAVRLKEAKAEDQVAVAAAFAREKGFDLTEKDLAPSEEEMDPGELSAVAGGKKVCLCVVTGEGSDRALYCYCVSAGYGEMSVYGISSLGGCVCVGAGAGASKY